MMWQNTFSTMMTPWAMPFAFYWFFPLLIWSLAWKGLAMWHAARRGEVYWFAALLLINTVGILEILYLYAFGGKEEKKSAPSDSSVMQS